MKELLSIALSLAPAVYLWWWGRRLASRLDDPAFAEIRFAHRQRVGLGFCFCLAASLALSLNYAWIKVPLAALGLLAAAYPARKRIYGESWGLGGYLSHTLRFWFANLAVWIFIALIPVLARLSGDLAAPVAAACAIVALVWGNLHARIVPWILGAKPLANSDLCERFDDVVSRARCPRPRTLVAETHGGHWVNAFALPSRSDAAVLFTGGLLQALTPAETVAIFGHELAHLEYFDRRRLLKRQLAVGGSLAALVVVFSWPAARFGVPLGVLTWVWPLAILLLLGAMASGNQGREHGSDLRALELTKDPEPLVAALTKIHRAMHLPRRWQAGRENRVSHPSLAARLRAIREAAGTTVEPATPEPAPEVVIRSARDAETVVVFAADRIHWLRGVDPEDAVDPAGVGEAVDGTIAARLGELARDWRAIRYADLADLRLQVGGLKGRYLRAVDRDGATLEIALGAEDVVRVKAALERTDLVVRGTSQDGAREAGLGRRVGRLSAVLAALLGLIPPFSLPLVLVSGVALLRPARVSLAAAGVIAIASGVLGLRTPASPFGATLILPQLLRALVGALLILEGRAWRLPPHNVQARRATTWTLCLLGALAVLTAVNGMVRIAGPPHIMQLHLWARYQPGLVLTLIGAAAALLAMGRRRLRLAAYGVVAVALLLVAIGSRGFRDRWGDDPLARGSHALEPAPLALEMIREVAIDGQPLNVRLSPSGRRLAVQLFDSVASGRDGAFEGWFQVEMGEGRFATVRAVDLDFLSDDRLATLRRGEDGRLRLQLLRTTDGLEMVSERPLVSLWSVRLQVDPALESWEVIGIDYEAARATHLSGSFADSSYRSVERDIAQRDDAYLAGVVLDANGRAVAVLNRFDVPGFVGLFPMLWSVFGMPLVSEVWLVDDSGARLLALTTLQPQCMPSLPGEAEVLCVAYNQELGTRIFTVDPAAAEFRVVGTVPGYYQQSVPNRNGRVLLSGYGVAPLQIDLGLRQAWRLDPAAEPPTADAALAPGADRWISELFAQEGRAYSTAQAAASQGEILALASWEEGRTRVTLYRLGETGGVTGSH